MARVAGSRRHDRGPVPPEGEPDLVVVGRIGRPQGLKGEVTVEVRTDDPDDRFAAGRVLVTDDGPLTVESSRWHGKFLVVRFEGVPDRTAAELLRDRIVQVDRATLPPLESEDDFYDSDLAGLRAELTDGSLLGTVLEILHLPHGDVLVLTREDAPEVLVPFVKAIVPIVDVAGGRVVVDPPPGLLDLTDGPAEEA